MYNALFPLGQLFITPGAQNACAALHMPPLVLLVRHGTGDWTDMSAEDREANQRAINEGTRIVSAYQIANNRFFVITEADRMKTTILLAHEY